MKKVLLIGVCAAGLAASPFVMANTITYTFDNITHNNANDAALGEDQLRVDLSEYADGQVAFKFYHDGTVPMSITDVYFDDGTLLGIAQIINGAGVAFSLGASPGELPGANNITPNFETTAFFLADSDSPTQRNGVNPGEELTIVFNLLDDMTSADTFLAMGGDLRVGIHVQGFESGGSESFVAPGTSGSPSAPDGGATAVMLGLGVLGLGLTFKRKS